LYRFKPSRFIDCFRNFTDSFGGGGGNCTDRGGVTFGLVNLSLTLRF
jgi:hypothetical protein